MIHAPGFLLDGSDDPLALIALLPDLLRLRIEIAPEPHPDLGTPCWLWMHRLNRNGYGRVCIDGREPVAHRETFERFRGPIPPRRIIDHRCRVRRCVNPWHLEPVTHRVNTFRGDAILYRTPESYLAISRGNYA